MNSFAYGDSVLSYLVSDDGYDIYLDNVLWISQHEPYIPIKTKTYEENAVIQINQLIEIYNEAIENSELEDNKDNDINSLLVDFSYRVLLLELDL